MQKIKFAYNEPRLGEIEIDPVYETGTVRSQDSLTEEDILRLIEEQFPEAIDVEILESEYYNG